MNMPILYVLAHNKQKYKTHKKNLMKVDNTTLHGVNLHMHAYRRMCFELEMS